MPLFVTPRQLTQRSEVYRQLSQIISAGIPIIQALDILAKSSGRNSNASSLREVSSRLSQGETVGEAWRHFGTWVPDFDIALVKAAENSGHLDSVFLMLADHYLNSARLMKQIISDMAYPVFVLHAAVVLIGFLKFIQNGNALMFMAIVLGVLLPIYGIVIGVTLASRSNRSGKWRTTMDRWVRRVPLLGSGKHALSLSRLASSLGALINAGVNIIEAWEMSAAASGSPALETAVCAWKPRLISGSTPSELVNKEPQLFPEFFANLYNTGEVSGKLDESLKRISTYFLEEGTAKLRLLGQWIPRLVFMIVAILVGFVVISFYSGYFKMIEDATNMRG